MLGAIHVWSLKVVRLSSAASSVVGVESLFRMLDTLEVHATQPPLSLRLQQPHSENLSENTAAISGTSSTSTTTTTTTSTFTNTSCTYFYPLRVLLFELYGQEQRDVDSSYIFLTLSERYPSLQTSLQSLSVRGSTLSDLMPLAAFRGLTTLSIDAATFAPAKIPPRSGADISLFSTAMLAPLRQPAFQHSVLRTVSLDWCTSLASLEGIEGLANTLEDLSAQRTHIPSLAPLAQCLGLRRLDVAHCAEVRALDGLEHLAMLHTLNISWTAVVCLRLLRLCQSLRTVRVDNCRQLLSLEGLEGLPRLRAVSARMLTIRSASPLLHNAPALETIDIGGCHALRTFEGNGNGDTSRSATLPPQSSPTQVEMVPLSANGASTVLVEVNAWASSLVSTAGLAPALSFAALRRLNLGSCRQLRALVGVADLPHLEALCLCHCASLASLSDLQGGCRALRSIDVRYCQLLTTLDGLEGMPRLATVNAESSLGLLSVAALETCQSLESLNVKHCRSLRSLGRLRERPTVAIHLTHEEAFLLSLRAVGAKLSSAVGHIAKAFQTRHD